MSLSIWTDTLWYCNGPKSLNQDLLTSSPARACQSTSKRVPKASCLSSITFFCRKPSLRTKRKVRLQRLWAFASHDLVLNGSNRQHPGVTTCGTLGNWCACSVCARVMSVCVHKRLLRSAKTHRSFAAYAQFARALYYRLSTGKRRKQSLQCSANDDKGEKLEPQYGNERVAETQPISGDQNCQSCEDNAPLEATRRRRKCIGMAGRLKRERISASEPRLTCSAKDAASAVHY
jgi:hypothetical protein